MVALDAATTNTDYVQLRIDTTRDGERRALYAKVDRADWHLIEPHSWHVTSDGRMFYAQTQLRDQDTGRRGTISMGRLLMGEGMLANLGRIDHMNGNGMDCRRSNLRIVTQAQILAKRRPTGGRSRYKGVTWDAETGKWVATFRGRKVGRFTVEKDAARAFDEVALAHWGADAYLNFPPRPHGAPMTGAKARLATFALDALLDTEPFQTNPEDAAALRAVVAAVERWTHEPVGWIQPRLDAPA